MPHSAAPATRTGPAGLSAAGRVWLLRPEEAFYQRVFPEVRAVPRVNVCLVVVARRLF